MDVTKYLDGCINAKYHWLFLENSHAFVGKGQDVLSSEGKVAITVVLG